MHAGGKEVNDMNQAQALSVIRSLANGVDPETGEVLACRHAGPRKPLAVFRGRALEVLDVKLVQPEFDTKVTLAEGRIAVHLGWHHQARPSDDLIRKVVVKIAV